MNWAAEHELPEGQKTPHFAVQYEHPSKRKDHRCGNCKNFIIAHKLRCRTVQPPIRREDWCVRYSPVKLENGGEE